MARAIADAGWAEFAALVSYEQVWRAGSVTVADRWFPSSRRCSACGAVKPVLTSTDRVFVCGCGFQADRDHNAAVNLARWPRMKRDFPRSPDPRAGGRVTNVRRREGADRHLMGVGETVPVDAGTEVHVTAVA
ncbi:transposase [Nocardia mangyaensis]|uniref:transposase n=1 Tax=Nocardia mangyaensis TaxID=2213200 RepID=UPI0026770109|nr:transposase [Nocardia mangyaensis]MDO3650162.1 transposase [Nocardia mangyaensis]